MARLEAGLVELTLEPVDLAGLMEDCAGTLRAQADQRGVAIAVEVEPGLALNADRRAVKQILLNLLSNAVKFTPPGGHVWAQASMTDTGIALRVSDDGVGIPASELPRLGRAFEQVCADARLAKNGAGLGLALVRALAEKHGGSLSIQSEEGVGTTVTVELPAEPVRAVA